MEDVVKLHSSIKPELKRKLLFKGTLIACFGMAILLLILVISATKIANFWGFFLFIFGMGCITLGLLPYKNLIQKEKKPDSLVVDQQQISYSQKGVLAAVIPWECVKEIGYKEKENSYGIAFLLKANRKKKIILFHPNQNKLDFLKEAEKHSCDFFLPYFSKNSTKNLEEIFLSIDQSE